ncbi:MAG TPA: hypothetical protein VJ890_30080, partial [Vineibacter sp.]|nr:hypothetical protein [Vineibacter sp.]
MRRIESAHIVSDGSPVHDKGVSEIVEGKLAPSKTGAAIFALIRAHGWVVVRPYNQGDFNARARVNPELEWLKGQPGLVAEIEFSSSTFAHVIWVKGVPLPNPRAIVFPGFEADEVLLHELVHAARALSGDFDAAAMKGAMAPYDTEEEFVAIMVANIYISEKGKPAVFLRRSHSTEATGLAEKDTDPEIFLYKDDNYRLVKKFCDQHPRVSRMVADVPAKFNPVRAYYDTTTLTIKEDIDVPVPYRVKQSYERPPLTDDYLIRLLKPRYRE